jgi:hypothetical protein
MSLFSDMLTGGYKDAAGATSTGLQTGYNQAGSLYDTGRTAATTNYAAALDPFNQILKSTAPGVNAYGTALGLGGNPADVQKQLEATPGYQFNLTQGLQAIDRGAASRGLTTSGNTIAAEQKYGAGLASQTYNDYVANLARFLPQQLGAATGAANVNMGLGSTINSSYGNQGNLAFNTQAGIGNAQAGSDIAGQNAQNSFLKGVMDLGGKLLGAKGGGGGDPTSLPSLGFGTPFLSGGFGV